MTPQERDELDALAGEYVLGLLSPATMEGLERRLASDPELRKAVAYWQDRLLPLTSLPKPAETDPALWKRISDDLPSDRPIRRASAKSGLWQSLAFWRSASAVAVGAALVLALSTVTRLPIEPAYIAVLQRPDATPGWIVHAAPGQPVRLTPLVRTDVAANQSLQFWTLFDKAQGPVSLGLVTSQEHTVEFPAEKLPGLKEGQLFEITLEPYGGSTVGRPTGAVLFKGLTVRSG
jgi:anti-sigma-K factor RskA